MKVSIITASYNSEDFIRETISSVLGQTYQNIEYIIIDGGSSDLTLSIIKEYKDKRLKGISEPDESMYDAINKGIQNSTGEVIGTLNSDDYLVSKNVIEKIVNTFKQEKICGLYGNIVKLKDGDTYTRKGLQVDYKGLLSFGSGSLIPHPTLYIKREVHEKIKGYDLSYKYASDLDYILKILEIYDLKYLHQDITVFRVHPGSITSSGKIKKERDLVLSKHSKINKSSFCLKFYYKVLFIIKNIHLAVKR